MRRALSVLFALLSSSLAGADAPVYRDSSASTGSNIARKGQSSTVDADRTVTDLGRNTGSAGIRGGGG